MKKLICIYFCLLAGPILAQTGTSADQLFYEAQALQSSYRDGEAMLKYEEIVKAKPSHYESLCELVMLKSRIAGRTPDEAKKINYYYEAKNYAMQAYELKPNSAQSNYIMALGIGGAAQIASARQALAFSYEMRSYLDKALELDPKHAGAWHLLGRWHYKIANLGFTDVAIAKLFFGGIPKGASNQKAVECLQKAIALNQNEITYYYDLARVYENQNEIRSCVEVLEIASSFGVTTSDELEIQRRCRYMLKKYEYKY